MKTRSEATKAARPLDRLVSVHEPCARIVAWADSASAKVSRSMRKDFVAPEPLVRLADVQKIVADADATAAKIDALEQLVTITKTRGTHLEIELAHARVSRDSYRAKYEKVAAWVKAHVTIAR